MTHLDTLIQKINTLEGVRFGSILVENIPFFPELRKACEENYCGNYGRNWKCPPHVGEINQLIAQAKTYQTALIFQKIYPLEDSFDFEGMMTAGADFRNILHEIGQTATSLFKDCLVLGAGGCNHCQTCAILEEQPCRFPNISYASLEAYGIQVSTTAELCGMKYINGVNTVTYFGGILFNPSQSES